MATTRRINRGFYTTGTFHPESTSPWLWKTKTAVGLGMAEGLAEIVIQNERNEMETDIKVDSVIEAVKEIKQAGGTILSGPFDIKIGKCAVVKDPWGNQYVILDSTKGTFITDKEGKILGHKKS